MAASNGTYLAVTRHPLFRRVVPGLLFSGLGDGLSLVAIPWTALTLAQGERDADILVGAALAAYTLPGAVGAYAFRRICHRFNGSSLSAADGMLRAVMLGLVPFAAAAHLFNGVVLVILLGCSSLLYAWGIAGRFSFLSAALSGGELLAANTIALTGRQAASMFGSLVAAPLIGWVGGSGAIGIDAATFAVLAISYWLLPITARPVRPHSVGKPALSGIRVIGRDRTLAYFIAISVLFSVCNGMARAVVPVHAVVDMHGSAHLLGWFWTAAGLGALIGGAATRHLHRWQIWRVMLTIVTVTGVLLLPVALIDQPVPDVTLFALANACAAPLPALAFFITQKLAPPDQLTKVLADRSSLLMISTPAGNSVGGLLLSVVGPRWTMLGAATAMVTGGSGVWLTARRVLGLADQAVADKHVAEPERVAA